MKQHFQDSEPWRDPNFRSTIDREFVHRHSVSEVFPTAVTKTSDSEFTVYLQWPRWHVFYGGWGSRYDSALVLETLRQLTVLIAHTHLNVPLGRRFLMPKIGITMTPDRRRDKTQPANVTAKVHVTNQRATQKDLMAFGTAATFFVNGEEIASGEAAARIVDPVIYTRFREARMSSTNVKGPKPVPAPDVGHFSDWNVVLGCPSGHRRWRLRVDTTNPILFDHPLDHIPGVLLIEAVRQLLRLELRNPALDFIGFESQFLALAELGKDHEVVLESLSTDQDALVAVVSIQSEGGTLMRTVARIRPKHPHSVERRLGSPPLRKQAVLDPTQRAHE